MYEKTSRKYENSGYSHHGASRSKPSMLRWISTSKSPHEDISENAELLRERSRDLYAGGGPLGRGAVDRLILNAIGSGLRLNVRIDPERLRMTEEESRKWAAEVESQFDYWASSKSADFTGRLNFYELQVLAFKSVLLDGECLVNITYGHELSNRYKTKIQLIESDRLMTPVPRPLGAIIDEGVEIDEYGTPLAYWISNRNPKAELINQPSQVKYARIEAKNPSCTHRILHIINPERINQNRGVPFLAPVIEQLKQLGRYTDAELMAAVISGMYAVFFEHEFRPEGMIGEEQYASEEGLGHVEGDEREITQEQMYGLVMDLPEGVKATSVSPSRPNTSFEAFVEALVRQIGGCLGIPSELLFLHFTASYSASRGALLEAWKLFRYWREWFAVNFCQPVYEAWLEEAEFAGRIKARGYDDDYVRSLYTWSEWTGPSQGQLDPVKEVNAAVLRVKNGFSTHQRETAELTGGDYDLNMKQLQREMKLRNVPDKERE